LDEGCSQAVDRWPFHPEVRVPPPFLVAGVARPLLGNSHSTGEPDGFVDNAHFAMTTTVLLEGRVPPDLAVPVHIDTRVLHGLDDPVLDLDTAKGVDEDPHPQPCLGAVTQRVCELLSGPALPVHKGHEVEVCCAFLIASSIAGKISSPLRRTVIALPSVKWTPTRHSKERRNCRRVSSLLSDVAWLSTKVVRLLPGPKTFPRYVRHPRIQGAKAKG
jgi:hypothetical protein